MQLKEQPLETQEVYRGRILRVEKMTVRLPNGALAQREIVRHQGACAIVAVDEGGRVALVRQYRAPLDDLLLEVPAGKLEPGEDPLACARRELWEETGLTGGRWQKLTELLSTPGFCDEKLHVYLAEGVQLGEGHPDADEFVETEWLPLQQAVAQAYAGQLTDGKTIVGLLLAAGRRACRG